MPFKSVGDFGCRGFETRVVAPQMIDFVEDNFFFRPCAACYKLRSILKLASSVSDAVIRFRNAPTYKKGRLQSDCSQTFCLSPGANRWSCEREGSVGGLRDTLAGAFETASKAREERLFGF